MKEFSNIQLQIKETIEQYESLKHIKAHISEIDIQLKATYDKIKIMDGQLDKELEDINSLESLSVKSIFYKTLGSKEEQLEKERQEYLELSLKYKEYKKETELMEYERGLLSKKLNSIPLVEKKLQELKNRRETEILSSPNTTLKNEFKELLHKMDVNIALAKELEEAIIEGQKSLKILSNIIAYLQKAEDWGRWDMYGDNRRAKYIKKQSIDQALRLLPSAQHQLNMLMRELADLGEREIVLKLDTVHFDKFRDFFFDNLISDWIIQQRIRNTLNNIEATTSHVKRIILSLEQERKSVAQKLLSLNATKESLILS